MRKCLLNPEMSVDKQQRFREAFDLFDKDRDGFIGQEELGVVMRSLGATPPKESELREWINESSGDGEFTARGGKISFQTFCNMMVRSAPICTNALISFDNVHSS